MFSNQANSAFRSRIEAPRLPMTPVTPGTPITGDSTEIPSVARPKPLALRELFFPLVPYSPPESEPILLEPNLPSPLSVHDGAPLDSSPLTSPITTPPTEFDNAIARVERLDAFLTPGMKSTLTCMLSVLDMHLSPKVEGVAATHCLIMKVASPEQTPDASIKDLVDTIERGLMVFCALGGGSVKSVADPDVEPQGSANDGATGSRKRQKRDVDGNVTKSTRRSEKVRRECKARDPMCQICNALNDGDVAHIIPYSVKEKKAIDFWKFVELFHGVENTAALREITLGPNAGSADTVKNVWFLCKMCHDGFDHGKLSVIPDLDGITYPYDPDRTNEYSATIEFPRGNQAIQIACWKRDPRGRMVYDKTLDEGHVITLSTENALDLPLPHPLLFQIHAIICRVIALKAAAGFPLFPGFDCGDYDDSGVPAFVDNTFVDWLDHHASKENPDILPERYDSNSAEPRIVHWLNMTRAVPVIHGLGSPNSSESDSDINTEPSLKREHGKESDKDEEHPRKYTVVLSEVGQRLAEKWQMIDRRLDGPESSFWCSDSGDSSSVY